MTSIVKHADQLPQLANRFVLLGASNLTFSLRLIIYLLQQRLGGPSDVLVAAGHGRSYGECSQVMFRQLPGIISSDLWERLEFTNIRPAYALVTDIGNDIPYGYSPSQILAWLRYCITRLQRKVDYLVVTNIPIESIEALPKWRYNLLRPILFPSCSLSWEDVVECARIVHQGLVEMASQKDLKDFKLVEVSKDWFGADAIHVRYWQRKAFYQKIFENFPVPEKTQLSCDIYKQLLFAGWQSRPHFAYKKVFGLERFCHQPSGYLRNGTVISKY